MVEISHRAYRYVYVLDYRKGNASIDADFLPRLPSPATESGLTGGGGLTPLNEERIFPVRRHSLLLGGPSTMRVGLGGLPLSLHDF